ncbi:MAG: alpha/beta fold hydrolase [Bacteroidota bacterium]
MKFQLIRLLSVLFPRWMVQLAYRQLTNPQLRKLRTHELAVLDQAEQERMAFGEFEIQLYHWPGGEETVFLVHGWEGQAGNFADLIPLLLDAGFTVRAFDGPSHGFSSQGSTSLFEFAELVGKLAHEYQAKYLVSHSFGGVATTYGLSQQSSFPVKRYALLTTPDRFRDRIEMVSRQVGITRKVQERLTTRLEQELGMSVDTLNVSDFAPQLAVAQARIWHDEADRVIPLAQSQQVAENWPVCELEVVQGTGHFRILRTPEVLAEVVRFLKY